MNGFEARLAPGSMSPLRLSTAWTVLRAGSVSVPPSSSSFLSLRASPYRVLVPERHDLFFHLGVQMYGLDSRLP